MVHDLLRVVNGARSEPSLGKTHPNFFAINLHESRFDFGLEIIAIFHPVDVIGEARVIHQLRPTDFLTEFAPGPVIPCPNKNVYGSGANVS